MKGKKKKKKTVRTNWRTDQEEPNGNNDEKENELEKRLVEVANEKFEEEA